jgi:hypothetical protein
VDAGPPIRVGTVTGLLFRLLKYLGERFIHAYNQRVDVNREILLTRVKEENATDRVRMEVMSTLQARQAGLTKAAMAHRTFWIVWGLFAIPLGCWWALVMVDTMTPPEVLSLRIPSLPPSIQPYADQIFNNVFYSGAGMGAAQILGRAALGRRM